MYRDLLDGTDIAVPDNVVTPSLLSELKKAGVTISESGRVKNSDRDSVYMDAIKRGDMTTAKKMVEQAAKDSGYTRLFYHGSKKGGGFKIFRDWQYFTENKEYAK